MKSYNIVTNFKINQIIKSSSKYYNVSLGLSATTENNDTRVMNQRDEFAYFYNLRYRTTILGQGSIGNIKFYTDHYIKLDQVAFYFNQEEFIFDFDEQMVRDKGIDFYLGHLIKSIETEYADRLRKQEDEKLRTEKKLVGDAQKVFSNPGAVSYDDLKAYLEKQRLERLKV